MDEREQARDVVEHYQARVMRGRKDQTRTIAASNVVMAIFEGWSPGELKLAANRYAMELDAKAIPVGARTFYGSERMYAAFLEPGWEPPKTYAPPAVAETEAPAPKEVLSMDDARSMLERAPFRKRPPAARTDSGGGEG